MDTLPVELRQQLLAASLERDVHGQVPHSLCLEIIDFAASSLENLKKQPDKEKISDLQRCLKHLVVLLRVLLGNTNDAVKKRDVIAALFSVLYDALTVHLKSFDIDQDEIHNAVSFCCYATEGSLSHFLDAFLQSECAEDPASSILANCYLRKLCEQNNTQNSILGNELGTFLKCLVAYHRIKRVVIGSQSNLHILKKNLITCNQTSNALKWLINEGFLQAKSDDDSNFKLLFNEGFMSRELCMNLIYALSDVNWKTDDGVNVSKPSQSQDEELQTMEDDVFNETPETPQSRGKAKSTKTRYSKELLTSIRLMPEKRSTVEKRSSIVPSPLSPFLEEEASMTTTEESQSESPVRSNQSARRNRRTPKKLSPTKEIEVVSPKKKTTSTPPEKQTAKPATLRSSKKLASSAMKLRTPVSAAVVDDDIAKTVDRPRPRRRKAEDELLLQDQTVEQVKSARRCLAVDPEDSMMVTPSRVYMTRLRVRKTDNAT